MDISANVKKYGRSIGRILGFACLLACYFMALQYERELEACRQTAVILMEGSPLTASQVLRMMEQEKEQEQPRSFCAWQQENEVTAENEDLNRICTVSAVAVCGRSDIVMPGSTWIDEEDREGCLLDEKTAIKLFGSTEVTGMTLKISGGEKRIRGILYGASDVILYQADAAQSLENLTVSMRADEGYDSIRQGFMMRYALSGRFLRMDTICRAAKMLCLMIPLLAGGQILAEGVRAAWSRRKEREGIYYLIASVFCMGILLVFLLGNMEIPKDMIPTKWSDFDFWKNWWQNEKESLLLLLLTEKQKPQQICLTCFYPVLKWGILAFLLQYLQNRLLRGTKAA